MSEFNPPIENASLPGEPIRDIAENLLYLKSNSRFEWDKRSATSISESANALSIAQAKLIGCDDTVIRLQRNAIALCNLIEMVSSCIDCMQSEVRTIIDARNTEHDQYLARLKRMREIQTKQYNAAKSAKCRNKKNN